MSNNDKKKKAKMSATRLLCLILAGLMVIGTVSAAVAILVATLAA